MNIYLFTGVAKMIYLSQIWHNTKKVILQK